MATDPARGSWWPWRAWWTWWTWRAWGPWWTWWPSRRWALPRGPVWRDHVGYRPVVRHESVVHRVGQWPLQLELHLRGAKAGDPRLTRLALTPICSAPLSKCGPVPPGHTFCKTRCAAGVFSESARS